MLAHLAACAAAHDRELDDIVGDRKGRSCSRLLRRIVAELE